MSEYNQEPKEVLEERKETKKFLLENTNIENSPEEMNVLDNIIFRLWQCGLTIKEFKKLTKYKRAFEILKEVVIVSNLDGTYLLSVWANKLMPEPVCYLEKEQGELLEELMKSENIQ